MLLTDALPNVGQTGQDDFLGLARTYAAQGIGLSSFGVGVNFGQELAVALSMVRGGNYFFLEDAARIAEVFDLDFDYLVTPLAYDMRLVFTPEDGTRVVGVHGNDSWEPGQDVVRIDVATLFLSRGHGAIVIQLGGPGVNPM
jgi:Ca-activated chloride channel family protein